MLGITSLVRGMGSWKDRVYCYTSNCGGKQDGERGSDSLNKGKLGQEMVSEPQNNSKEMENETVTMSVRQRESFPGETRTKVWLFQEPVPTQLENIKNEVTSY